MNGRSVGKKELKNDCIAKFRCTYEDGTVEAVSYDAAGKELGRCSLRTAAPETQLRAVSEENAVAPGRLCHIRLQYTDESGILKPLERGILNVEVSGGKLLGLGSACPYNEIGFCEAKTDTYYGEALAVMQAGEDKNLTLTVTDGRHTGSVLSLTAHDLTKWHLPYYDNGDGSEDSKPQLKDNFASNLFRHLVFGADFRPSDNFRFGLGYNYRTRTDMSTYRRSILSGFSACLGLTVRNFALGVAMSQPHTGATTIMLNLSTSLYEF